MASTACWISSPAVLGEVRAVGFATTDFPDVNLLLGKTLSIDSALKVGGVSEAISVTAESPLIDTRNTTIAHNVSAEEFERIPKGRTFQNLALSSPSVNAGEVEGGIQVNGASGSENSFTVDGVVTNSLINGASRQDAVFEYLQEVQVKTGGISAEYRRRARRRHQRGDQVGRQLVSR